MTEQIKNKITNIIKILLVIQIFLGMYPVLSLAESLDPYSFDQTRELQPVLQENFMPAVLAVKKPRPLPNSAPTSPTIVTDADGNKFIYEDGQLRVKFDSEGNQVYYAKRQPRLERDYEGSLTKLYEYDGPRAILKNEWGEIIGYEEFGKGGLLLKEFDEDSYLTQTYLYQNRTLEWILDNLYESKTKYNLDGPQYEMDFEGNTIAYYITQNRRIQKKIEKTVNEKGEIVDGDTTVYAERGKYPLYTLDFEGNTGLTYNYAEFNRLKSTTDQYGNITEYKKKRSMVLKHKEGGVFKVWNWQGTKLINTEDKVNHNILGLEGGAVVYFKNNKPLYARFEDGIYNDLVERWVYDEGRLLAHWEAGRDGVEPNKIILYDHGRQVISFPWEGNYPTEKELLDWAKSKKLIIIDGRVRGAWDNATQRLMVFDVKGEVIEVLSKEKPPTQEELLSLF